MNRLNIKGAAPMPTAEEDIKNNSMKLYAYLVTIAGLADYPSNTRMFRQKDLILTKIKEATGITDKTVKLYLFYLEDNGLIKYIDKEKFEEIDRYDFPTFKEYRLAAQKMAAKIWKERQKNKKGVYHIPRPLPYTPIPEITLKRLNEDFQITELEMDLYLFFCKYRDLCFEKGLSFKAMTYEQIRDILDLEPHHDTNKAIFSALTFLEKIKLIDFSIGYEINSKKAKIPRFKITEVYYYIGEPIVEFNESEILTKEESLELKEINQRIKIGYEKYQEKQLEV